MLEGGGADSILARIQALLGPQEDSPGGTNTSAPVAVTVAKRTNAPPNNEACDLKGGQEESPVRFSGKAR
jgi:hypothetical protein